MRDGSERPALTRLIHRASQRLSGYGMLGVLLILCLYYTVATYHTEQPTGREGAISLAGSIRTDIAKDARIVIVAQTDAAETEFAETLHADLLAHGYQNVAMAQGDPPAVRKELEALAVTGSPIGLIATTPTCQGWTVFDALKAHNPAFSRTAVRVPQSGRRSTFLSPSNLRNVADQIAVIAIIAVGMTLVILTGGIDLSVGSLVALSAILTAWLIQHGGGVQATFSTMCLASLIAILACGAMGLFSGLMVTGFRIPSFIATLAIMQVASGLAFIVAQGQSINALPTSFTWLGRGENLASLPNAVVLMVLLYALAHLVMTRTRIGRYIYAVGGNSEAARLSGVQTRRILLFVYLISGIAAGIGGVITASQLQAGAPTYGQMYELYVIAAVVVGGTSLAGGEGRIFNTLIGAFIIAVIRNGMNLTNTEPYKQKVVLGLVILGAVLVDRLKRRRTPN